MSRHFVPDYDIKIRGGRYVIEWRYGAHPTVHAFSPSKRTPRSKSFPPSKRISKAGTVWSDANTAPIEKFPSPKPKKNTEAKKDDFKLTETENIALRNELKRSLQNVSKMYMKKILPNLRSADRNRTGRLSPEKVREILQKNQLSLGEAGFRNLNKKFGESEDDVVYVNYEHMIPFLTKIWSEAAELPKKKPSTPPAAGLFAYGSDRPSGKSLLSLGSFSSSGYSSYSDQSSNISRYRPRRILEMRNRVVFSDRDETQLLADLRRELSDAEVSMADLRRTMYDLDRDRNDFLNHVQVHEALQRCGIYLSPELFQRLLLATDRTGAGVYRIETLMNYLTRFQPESNNMLFLGNNHHPRASRIPILPALSNQPMFATPWDQKPHELESETSFLTDPILSDEGEDVAGTLAEEEEEEPFDAAKWGEDFLFLVEAIHQADEGKLGYMPEKEIRHLTKTYGLVYNLKISDSVINGAIRKAFDSKFNEINIDHYTGMLQELHFKEMKDN